MFPFIAYYKVSAEKWVNFIQIFRGKRQTILFISFIVVILLQASKGTSLTDVNFLHLRTYLPYSSIGYWKHYSLYVLNCRLASGQNSTFLNAPLSCCALI